MKLAGKRAVVTGASLGLGLSIARSFAVQGANVLMCARGVADLERASEEIRKVAVGKVIAMQADISREAGVSNLVGAAMERMGGTDILVCNAGVYGPKGALDELDWDEWVRALQINLLGTVLCCRLFLPLVKQSSRGKIILLSGGGATKPLPFLSAYAASKAAVVRFAETLAEELRADGIDVNSIAPGALNTRLLDEVIEAGPEKVGKAFHEAAVQQRESGGTPLEAGAELSVFLAGDESNGITGKLISAVWDPWREFGEHRDDLRNTDTYTLRRVVPKDRGLAWG